MVAGALVALAIGSGAQAQTSERYSLQGFGGWAMADLTKDGRWAEAATAEAEFGNYNFALNLAAQPTSKLSISSQAFWGQNLRGQKLSLDYAFAQYAHAPLLKLRAGKVLTPFGLYSEIYDVGTLRPFYFLPQFYQGRLGLIPKAYLGAGATGTQSLGGDWEASYDAFGGEIQFEEFTQAQLTGFDPATRLPVILETDTRLVGRKMVGGRLMLASPARGFDVGGSAIRIGDLKRMTAEGRVPFPTSDDATLLNGRLQYQRKGLAARAELFKVFTDKADVGSWYVEVSQKFLKRWQLAAQYEKSDLALLPGDNSVPPPLRDHESIGAALNFWFSPEFVIKLNAYHVEGNLLNRPKNSIVKYLTGTLETSSNVVVFGAQFSF
jgi:hypothetical protein